MNNLILLFKDNEKLKYCNYLIINEPNVLSATCWLEIVEKYGAVTHFYQRNYYVVKRLKR